MVGALPSRKRSPHLPRSPSVMAFSFESVEALAELTSADSASTDVNVIGMVAVPGATIRPPFKTTIAGALVGEAAGSEYTMAPASMFRANPEGTKSCDVSRYDVPETRANELVIVPPIATTEEPSAANIVTGTPEHVAPAILPLHASHE